MRLDSGTVQVPTGTESEGRLLASEKPALVLLDLVLPGTDGVELMGQIPALADVPVIFISGYGHEETVVRALEAGAEDYVVKPFSPTELVARVRTALRRRTDPEPFTLGDLAIDYDRRRVTMAGQPVELTATEYDLLRVLSLNAGRVSTYDALLRQVWGGRYGADEKIVRAYVKRLRKRLGDDARHPVYNPDRASSRLPHARPGRHPTAAAVITSPSSGSASSPSGRNLRLKALTEAPMMKCGSLPMGAVCTAGLPTVACQGLDCDHGQEKLNA